MSAACLDEASRDEILEMLEGRERITVNPALACRIGLNESIVLMQLNYWLVRSKNIRDGKVWVYKTHDQWASEFPFWSISTIRRAINSLRDMGLIESTDAYNRMKVDNTLWYTITEHNTDECMNRPPVQNEQTTCSNESDESVQNEHVSMLILNRPITKDYTETTAENSDDDRQAPDWPAVAAIYENEIGLFTAMTAELVQDDFDEYGGQWLVDAIREAVKSNVRRWTYVQGILRRWRIEGRGTLPNEAQSPAEVVELVSLNDG